MCEPTLLGVPTEIRLNIYEHLFATPGTVEVHWDKTTAIPHVAKGNSQKPKQFAGTLGLLRVCKQIHDEATTILYGKNEFRLHLDRLWINWTDNIDIGQNVTKLRKITLVTKAGPEGILVGNTFGFLWDVPFATIGFAEPEGCCMCLDPSITEGHKIPIQCYHFDPEAVSTMVDVLRRQPRLEQAWRTKIVSDIRLFLHHLSGQVILRCSTPHINSEGAAMQEFSFEAPTDSMELDNNSSASVGYKTYRLKLKERQRPTLVDLPPPIMDRILEHIVAGTQQTPTLPSGFLASKGLSRHAHRYAHHQKDLDRRRKFYENYIRLFDDYSRLCDDYLLRG